MVPCVDVIMPDGSVECFECRYLSQDIFGCSQDPEPLPVEGWNFNKINNQWHAYKTVKV